MAHTERSSLVVFHLLSLLLLSTHALDTDVNLIHIRLADGVDRSPEASHPSSSYLNPPGPPQHPSSTSATKSTITRPPARPYGPRLLRGLAGDIFSVTEGGYHYKLKMFDSVSQRKTTENEPLLLGVWDRWEVVEREEEVVGEMGKRRGKALSLRMVYMDGATCMANTSVVRTVLVDFLCAASPIPRADESAASAAIITDGDAVALSNDDDSTGTNLVDRVVKAREEGRVVQEGEDAAAVFVQEVQQQPQQISAATATATAILSKMEAEAASYISTHTYSPSPPPPPPPQEVVDFRLSDARESSVCLHHLTLHSPIPCAVLHKELASFATQDLIKGEDDAEEEAKRGGGTKRQRKKKSKGKKVGRKRGMVPLIEGVTRWVEEFWGKAVRATANSLASSNDITSSSSSSASSSVCTCPCAVDTGAAAPAAPASVAVCGEVGEKEKDRIEALINEVGELRSQLADFLEEMRGGREGGREEWDR